MLRWNTHHTHTHTVYIKYTHTHKTRTLFSFISFSPRTTSPPLWCKSSAPTSWLVLLFFTRCGLWWGTGMTTLLAFSNRVTMLQLMRYEESVVVSLVVCVHSDSVGFTLIVDCSVLSFLWFWALPLNSPFEWWDLLPRAEKHPFVEHLRESQQ